MSVVTLTGHLGSMGEVARIVARRLDYTLIDRELLIEAAQALGWTEEQVTAFDERTRGQGGRLMRLLGGFIERAGRTDVGVLSGGGMEAVFARSYADASAPEMRPDDERYVETLTSILRELGERGNIVIVGRGAQAVLAGQSDALHVRVACDQAERARRVAQRDRQPFEEALKRVRSSDEQREAWHHKYFDIDYRAPYHYHVIVNTGLLDDEQAADVILHTHGLLFGSPGVTP